MLAVINSLATITLPHPVNLALDLISIGTKHTGRDLLTILDVDFSPCFTNDSDITASWSLFRDTVIDACYKLVPLRKTRRKQYPPWYTSHIIHSLYKVKSLRRLIKTKQYPSFLLLDKLKILEPTLPLEMADAKEAYQFQLVSSFANTPRTLFRYLSNMYQLGLIPFQTLSILMMFMNLIMIRNVIC